MEKRKGKGAEESEQSTATFVVHSRVGQSSKQLCEIRELTKRVEKCFARGRSRQLRNCATAQLHNCAITGKNDSTRCNFFVAGSDSLVEIGGRPVFFP